MFTFSERRKCEKRDAGYTRKADPKSAGAADAGRRTRHLVDRVS
jgi:hypothetical protein